MRKSINFILKKNILIILLMISMCPILGFSYARFVINTESYRSNEMYIAELLYSVKIDDVNTYMLSIPKGESEHIIEITSIDMIGSNYKLIYQDNSNVKVEYASDYQDPAFGGILTKRTIMLRLTNNSEEDQTLSFSVVGGYSFNSLDDIDIPSGYTEVKSNYLYYDLKTVAYYVNNKKVNNLDENLKYKLISYACENNQTITYNDLDKSITAKPILDKVACSLYFEISNFESYINVTVTSPSSITCTNGDISYTVNDVTSYKFIVPNTGKWSITATYGSLSSTKEVDVTSDNQSINVELSYDKYIFKTGSGLSSGFTFTNKQVSSINTNYIIANTNGDYINGSSFYISPNLDMSGYSKLNFDLVANKYTGQYDPSPSARYGCSVDTTVTGGNLKPSSATYTSSATTLPSSRTVVSIDISNVNSNQYIKVETLDARLTIYNIWLEP